MNLIEEIRKDVVGAKVLADWIGDGVPVRSEHARGRAAVCLHGNEGNSCPHNKSPKWWEIFFKHPIAEAIRAQLYVKSKMNLSTPHDENLHMCSVCGCNLSLKVHTPIDHIKRHTSPDVLAQYPAYCWQRREMELT